MKIKKLVLSLVATLPLLGLVACGTSSKDACEWSKIKSVDIYNKSYYAGFEDKNYGETVGYSGEIHYTTDGGKTWPKGQNESYCRFGLDIVSKNVSWCCGNGGHVRLTIDGGKTWSKVTDYGDMEPNQCRYMSFFDDTTGWIAAPAKLGNTTDGGKTWNDAKLPDGIGDILSMNALDKDTAYLVDSNSKLYTTTNGGKSWTSNKIPTKDMENTVSRTNSQILRFSDKKNAVFFYFDNDENLHYLVTKDGGKTWNENSMGKLKKAGYGGLYLSHDGKTLTINDSLGTILVVLAKK